MRDGGIVKIYKLQNTAPAGLRPVEKLVEVAKAFYSDMRVGITRQYAAMGANQRVDSYVRCWNTIDIPEDAEYARLSDGKLYRIIIKQRVIEKDCTDLTLERAGEFDDKP